MLICSHNFAISIGMMKTEYREIDLEEINHLLNDKLILLVTATDLETKFTHQKMTPLESESKILKIHKGLLTIYIGKFGLYNIAHVQCSMGSISPTSSIMTVSTALSVLKSKIVIMVGIAFGMDEAKQNIGDVIVSETVIPYNIKRIGKKDTINRGKEGQASQILLNRIKNIRTWEFLLKNDETANLIFTRMLSGEELVDNCEYRNELQTSYPDSLGGEMEGVGVYSACANKEDWILIKGICDFADGNKATDKQARQELAIQSALSLCLELFNSITAFKELGVLPSSANKTKHFHKDLCVNDVLFDLYDLHKEKFYINRSNDELFVQKLKQYAIWVFGPPGCGKSNLILRNILNSEAEIISVNLAPFIGEELEFFFFEIFHELAAKTEGADYKTEPKNFNECNKEIVNLLKKHYKDKEVIILIDEIPIDSVKSHSAFAEKLFSLIISKNLFPGLNNVKFVLSSLENPISNIATVQQKIHQYMMFLQFEYWTENDINKLVQLIEDEIKWKLPFPERNKLISKSNGSPRFIKKFFRSIFTIEKNDTETLNMIITETERELKNG